MNATRELIEEIKRLSCQVSLQEGIIKQQTARMQDLLKQIDAFKYPPAIVEPEVNERGTCASCEHWTSDMTSDLNYGFCSDKDALTFECHLCPRYSSKKAPDDAS